MAIKIEKWKAKDETLHDSEIKANEHDKEKKTVKNLTESLGGYKYTPAQIYSHRKLILRILQEAEETILDPMELAPGIKKIKDTSKRCPKHSKARALATHEKTGTDFIYCDVCGWVEAVEAPDEEPERLIGAKRVPCTYVCRHCVGTIYSMTSDGQPYCDNCSWAPAIQHEDYICPDCTGWSGKLTLSECTCYTCTTDKTTLYKTCQKCDWVSDGFAALCPNECGNLTKQSDAYVCETCHYSTGEFNQL